MRGIVASPAVGDRFGRWAVVEAGLHLPPSAWHADWHDSGAFLAWIDENLGPCPDGHSLDRIDTEGDYAPGNVRWADRTTQNRNRRPSSQWRRREPAA